jgi:hypothetical protein
MLFQTPIARPKITKIMAQAMAEEMLQAREFGSNLTTQNPGNSNRVSPARKIRKK